MTARYDSKTMQTPEPGIFQTAKNWWRRPQGKIAVAATVATASILSYGGYTYAVNDTTVTISDNGETRDVKFWGRDVDTALAAAGLSLSAADRIVPSKDSTVSDGDRIEITRARDLTVIDAGESKTYQVAAATVGQALTDLDISTADGKLDVALDQVIPADGQTVTILRPQPVTVKVDGQDRAISSTAANVRELLTEAGIATDGDDLITPAPESAITAGMSVTVVKVDVREESRTEKIGHGERQDKTDDLLVGQRKVTREGADGERTIVTKIVTHDGKEVSRDDIRNDVTKAPVERVVTVGTRKPRPTATPEPKPAQPNPDASPRPEPSKPAKKKPVPAKPVPGGSVWDRLAQCESGGNWAANTGNGYYGGVQFSARTWKGLGAPGLPHQHSREVQIKYAKILQAKYGWGQWPACSRKLGLR